MVVTANERGRLSAYCLAQRTEMQSPWHYKKGCWRVAGRRKRKRHLGNDWWTLESARQQEKM